MTRKGTRRDWRLLALASFMAQIMKRQRHYRAQYANKVKKWKPIEIDPKPDQTTYVMISLKCIN